MSDSPLKYVTQPQEVEAMQYDGTERSANLIVEWVRAEGEQADPPKHRFGAIYIVTDYGSFQAFTDDFVVKIDAHEFVIFNEKAFHNKFTPKRR